MEPLVSVVRQHLEKVVLVVAYQILVVIDLRNVKEQRLEPICQVLGPKNELLVQPVVLNCQVSLFLCQLDSV